jgi:hypothetical protein
MKFHTFVLLGRLPDRKLFRDGPQMACWQYLHNQHRHRRNRRRDHYRRRRHRRHNQYLDRRQRHQHAIASISRRSSRPRASTYARRNEVDVFMNLSIVGAMTRCPEPRINSGRVSSMRNSITFGGEGGDELDEEEVLRVRVVIGSMEDVRRLVVPVGGTAAAVVADIDDVLLLLLLVEASMPRKPTSSAMHASTRARAHRGWARRTIVSANASVEAGNKCSLSAMCVFTSPETRAAAAGQTRGLFCRAWFYQY